MCNIEIEFDMKQREVVFPNKHFYWWTFLNVIPLMFL